MTQQRGAHAEPSVCVSTALQRQRPGKYRLHDRPQDAVRSGRRLGDRHAPREVQHLLISTCGTVRSS